MANYRPCDFDTSFIDDGSMSMYEKLCYMIKLFETAIGDLDGIDEQLEAKEDKINLTNVRMLSEDGDFSGTWESETKSQLDLRIQEIVDNVELKEGSINITDNRKLSENGDFSGTWFGETKVSMDNRIKNGDFTGTWNSVTYTQLVNDYKNGDFQGTWEGQTKSELDLQITGIETSYLGILSALSNNDKSFITAIDDGFVLETVTETEDYGLVTDPVTIDIDDGFIVYPCQCE